MIELKDGVVLREYVKYIGRAGEKMSEKTNYQGEYEVYVFEFKLLAVCVVNRPTTNRHLVEGRPADRSISPQKSVHSPTQKKPRSIRHRLSRPCVKYAVPGMTEISDSSSKKNCRYAYKVFQY